MLRVNKNLLLFFHNLFINNAMLIFRFKDGSSVVYQQEKATIALRRAVQKCYTEAIEEQQQITQSYTDNTSPKMYEDVLESQMNLQVKICKLIANKEKMSDEQYDEFTSAYTSEFWENQDIEGIEKAVEQFRRANQ